MDPISKFEEQKVHKIVKLFWGSVKNIVDVLGIFYKKDFRVSRFVLNSNFHHVFGIPSVA